MVAYKEILTKKVDHRETYKKQTGGRGKFGDIVFELGPKETEPEKAWLRVRQRYRGWCYSPRIHRCRFRKALKKP